MKDTSRKLDVLVADDEPDICEVLQDGLASFGIAIRSVGNGRESVLEALRIPPAAVLMDILMPVLSGVDALGLYKILEPLRSVPVFMLTAVKNKEDVIKAMRSGASDYICKPFDLKDTAERIRRAVARPSPAPYPIFKYLNYAALSDGSSLRLEIKGDLTQDSADELVVLIQSLAPIQPLQVDLDFDQVQSISGGLVSPLVAIRDGIQKAGGTVAVIRLDTARYRPAAVAPFRNIFKIDAEPGEGDVRREAKQKSDDIKKVEQKLSTVLTNIAKFRYTFKRASELSFLDFYGHLTADTRGKIEQAFGEAANSHSHILIRLDGLSVMDARGVLMIVDQIKELKRNEGLNVLVVCKNPEHRSAFHQARGHSVAGVYADRDQALEAFRKSV